jgi:hypothetical protein
MFIYGASDGSTVLDSLAVSTPNVIQGTTLQSSITVNGTLWVGKDFDYATTVLKMSGLLVVNGVINLGNDSTIVNESLGPLVVYGTYTCNKCTTASGCVPIICPF